MSQVVYNLVNSRVDVVAAEYLVDSWLVEIDLGILLDNFFVKGVKDCREVSGYGFELGYLLFELLALNGEDVGVCCVIGVHIIFGSS